MAGIMDFFKPAPAATNTGNVNQNQQGQGNNNNNSNNSGGGTGNANVQGPASSPNNKGNGGPNDNNNAGDKGEVKGIERFNGMWDTKPTDEKGPPSFSLDPKILSEVAGSQDFMQGIDPELMQKATSGDIQSLMKLINAVGQNSYAKSLEHGGTLTDRFVGAREAHSSKSLGKNVRSELTTSALSTIPNFKHPAVQRQLKDTAERLQQMHPDATPQEIANMSIEYYQELVAAINPNATANNGKDPASGAAKETNWDDFFSADQKQQAE